MSDVLSNPLILPSLQEAAAPYELVDFSVVSVGDFIPAFDYALGCARAEVEAIVACGEEPTWVNTVEALERSGSVLSRVLSVFFNVQATDHEPALDGVAEHILPALAAYKDWVYQNSALYERVCAVVVPDDEESQRLFEHYVRLFVRAGVRLGVEDRLVLSEINQRLSVLSGKFGTNLLLSTQRLSPTVDDGRGGVSTIALELPSMQSALERLVVRESRAQVLEASLARGAENEEIVREIVALRARRAALLGYSSHAEFVIEQETAPGVDAVWQLLSELGPVAAANAAGEFKILSDCAGEEPVANADIPFWQEQVRREDFALDGERLSQYFPLRQVLVDGVFFAAHRLYGVSVKPRPDLFGYHSDVDVWEVCAEDGSSIGLFLTDYCGRPSKRGGAWMSSFSDQAALTGSRPIVVNVMGVVKPEDGSEPLLSFDQVTTLFHEFGHALHGLLSNVRYPSFSGTSVPRDFVEFPSQLNENWAVDPVVVRNYARHYETGEVIPDSLLAALRRARVWGQGYATAEYLAAAVIDLAWHSLSEEEAAAVSDIEAFEKAALARCGLDDEHIIPRYKSLFFNHIFAGGYSAGYYSYLWAEVLDADAFDWFTEVGAAGENSDEQAVRRAGQAFYDYVLSRGASRDYETAFRLLRGRDKVVEPLLRRRGLDGAL